MARPVYSRPFIRQKGLLGDGDLVVVPNGYFYVVRALAVYWDSGLGALQVYFEHASTGQTLWYGAASAGSQKSEYLDCHIAFANSESFRFKVSSTGTHGADVFAGGYQLLAS